jgi:hypothetical protein
MSIPSCRDFATAGTGRLALKMLKAEVEYRFSRHAPHFRGGARDGGGELQRANGKWPTRLRSELRRDKGGRLHLIAVNCSKLHQKK